MFGDTGNLHFPDEVKGTKTIVILSERLTCHGPRGRQKNKEISQ